jgi:hypothetical protein
MSNFLDSDKSNDKKLMSNFLDSDKSNDKKLKSNFFDSAKSNVKELETNLLGPDYEYFKFIKPPEEMGMGADGSLSTLANDIGGLIGYVEVLVTGGGNASKVNGPLGNKFFLETGAKCTDVETGNLVTRSVYINNVPDGSIPFISAALNGQKMTTFEGLVPGTMSNLTRINPMQMFQAFMTGTNPDCFNLTLETIDQNNIKGIKPGFITVDDINAMDKDWFNSDIISKGAALQKIQEALKAKEATKEKEKEKEKEKFTTLTGYDYSKMPDDILVKVYYSALGLLVLYIFLRLFQKKHK